MVVVNVLTSMFNSFIMICNYFAWKSVVEIAYCKKKNKRGQFDRKKKEILCHNTKMFSSLGDLGEKYLNGV